MEQSFQGTVVKRMWIDSHAHLYDYTDSQLGELLDCAGKSDVGYILNSATNIPTAQTVVRQGGSHKILFSCVGISPFDVVDLHPSWFSQLEKLAGEDKVVAVGECGLDHSNPSYPSLDKQMPVFHKQLLLAGKLNLPAIIHSRGAEKLVLQTCKEAGIQKAVFHCFTGDIAVLKRILDDGYVISFSGIATFRKEPLSEQIRYCPLERMLIETDSPYLAPVPYRGKINQPCYVPLVGKKIAEIKGVSPQKVASTIFKTCNHLFPAMIDRKEK
ncbi:MAG: TatD family hydrolase [Chitinivibrionales bacterium]